MTASEHTRSALTRLSATVVYSAIAGLVLAGLALPFVGAAGMTAKAASNDFLGLPAELEAGTPALRSRVLAADGSLLAAFYNENRFNVPLADVPQHVKEAVLAIEDARFYEHNGVDYKGTLRAAIANSRAGGVTQGGSTLTQQYVKNALLYSKNESVRESAREQSIDRKLREARYATALERQLSKDQILERYLNIAYYGNGAYGIGAAASAYFDKPVQKLTIAEGALLAGLVQNPRRYDPIRAQKDPQTRAAMLARRDTVLGRMRELGMINPTEEKLASGPVKLKPKPIVSGCEAPGVSAPFYCDYVQRELLGDGELGKALGKTRDERLDRLFNGGLTIRTTLDNRIQAGAQSAVDKRVPRKDPSGAAAVANIVEPGTGEVKAMAVNRTFGENGRGTTKVNLAVGGTFGFQGGSTFKTFVLARAMEQNIPRNLTLNAPECYSPKEFRYEDGEGKAVEICNAEEGEGGTFDLAKATALSVNTYFIQLEERTGIDRPVAIAESLGLRRVENGLPAKPLERVPSFVLGTDNVSPLAMAGAYAAFAAHGNYCPPKVVTEVRDSRNRPFKLPEQSCRQVMEPEVADEVTNLLRGVVTSGTGRGANFGRPLAGKTGTAQLSRATWFIGYTPQLAAAVWVGKPTPTPLQRVSINGRYYGQVYGGSIAAPIFRDAMKTAHSGLPVQQFGRGQIAKAEPVAVPEVEGQTVDAAKIVLQEAGFPTITSNERVPSAAPRGTVAATNPPAGTKLAPGETVTLLLSTGRPPAPSSPPTSSRRSPGPQPSEEFDFDFDDFGTSPQPRRR